MSVDEEECRDESDLNTEEMHRTEMEQTGVYKEEK
jgi:hypothetical protein